MKMIVDHFLLKKKPNFDLGCTPIEMRKKEQGLISPSLYVLPRSLLWHGFKNHQELLHELALVSCGSSPVYYSQGRRAINSCWYLVSANQYSSISWGDKCLGPRAPGCYSCKNSATTTWMQRSACTAGRTPGLTRSELDQVPQNKKPQLSTTASGPLPFLRPKQYHCEYYHMLTKKMDSDQTGELIRTGA